MFGWKNNGLLHSLKQTYQILYGNEMSIQYNVYKNILGRK